MTASRSRSLGSGEPGRTLRPATGSRATRLSPLIRTIHTRMPVILQPKDYDRWLSRGIADQPPVDLLRPYEADAMTAHLTGNKQDEIFTEPNSA